MQLRCSRSQSRSSGTNGGWAVFSSKPWRAVFAILAHLLSAAGANNRFLRTDGRRFCSDSITRGLLLLLHIGAEGRNPRIASWPTPGDVYIVLYAIVLATLRFPEMSRARGPGRGAYCNWKSGESNSAKKVPYCKSPLFFLRQSGKRPIRIFWGISEIRTAIPAKILFAAVCAFSRERILYHIGDVDSKSRLISVWHILGNSPGNTGTAAFAQPVVDWSIVSFKAAFGFLRTLNEQNPIP